MNVLYPVTGYYFTGKWVFYSSFVKKYGARFMSCHDRTGLDDKQARHNFQQEHQKEVRGLILEKLQNDRKKNNGKIILSQEK